MLKPDREFGSYQYACAWEVPFLRDLAQKELNLNKIFQHLTSLSPQDVYHAMAHLQNSNGQLDRKGYVTFLNSLGAKVLLDKMHIAVPFGNSEMQMCQDFVVFFCICGNV